MRFDFLLCSERSGSNLITKIVDGHPAACGPFPSHMMRTFCPRVYLYGDLRDDGNWTDLTEDVADYLGSIFAQWESAVAAAELRRQCPSRTLAAIIRCVYEKEAATRGKERVFVKENHAFGFIPFTLAHFSASRFVWLVRDPRDMALCQRDSILSGGVQRAVLAWKEDQARSLEVYGYLRDTGRILLLTFENLVARAEDTVQQLCDFLDLPYTAEMLQFHRDPNVSRNAGAISAWADLGGPILTDNYNNYKTGLSAAEIRYVEAYCRDEMVSLGYAFDYDEAGDVAELRAALPDDATFDRPRNETEKARYTPFQEAQNRLEKRWQARRRAIL
jgi:sulfotransferase family protein